ncbi:hypothetical protein [Dellaglioa algida]|uniref:Uncharacterized protein n=1 Tax=Dellaglioa algida DSM 15638 TaxID=1423719 RepID=A0A0R1HFM1_9LACO|nr:hypothetical protein [Dellaglioa algida]KRK45116.1 hypothetical protein FC66_GL000519 [Dellaglioa algida DSM 15638]MDK1718153.1 hypothetical protein [Dellaglioa algida]MDK1726245.1 hypothetical protein [Dellaglioa algida]MDK1727665.1 hypothetical protein [Dellaglioa algida]MDK1729078.1 hypothetical protein [Dellaglioa algida]
MSIDKWNFRKEQWFLESVESTKKALLGNNLTFEQVQIALDEIRGELLKQQSEMKIRY